MLLRTAFLVISLLCSLAVRAGEQELVVPVDGQELVVQHYPAKGTELIIWIAPGFGSHGRVFNSARQFAERGIEVWHVDLSESLFLPGGTTTLRSFDGRYVAGLVDAAHAATGKRITLLSRAYGSLPVLKGARQWQLKHADDGASYLNGAILFSPETYTSIPALGLEPEYDPVVSATNIPIMIYQGGTRGNRWQLPDLLDRLYRGGAQVFVKVMPGVTGLYYEGDIAPATLRMLEVVPREINGVIQFLGKFDVPAKALPMAESSALVARGLDFALKPFRGDPQTLALDLYSADGSRVTRTDYRGKVTVVNFWATWCPPCVEEIPSLNNLRKKMQGKPFELISVNYAEDKKVIAQFLQRVNVDFPVLLDSHGRVSVDWGVIAYPSTFVIGRDGRIRYGVNAAIHWDSQEVIDMLDALLAE